MNDSVSTLQRLTSRFGPNVIAPLTAGAIAILISSLTLLAGGYNPARAFGEIGKVLWSFDSVVLILNRGSWYYVAGVAVAIGFKMGLFNIGADGQYRLAALFAAYAGAKVSLPAVLHVPFIILVAILVGGMWAGIAGLLKVTRGVNEVISTIMLNFIATGLIAYLLGSHFRVADNSLKSATKTIPISGRIPELNWMLDWIPGTTFRPTLAFQGYIVIAVIIGIAYYVLLFRSRFGYELRVSGESPSAAKSAGISPKRMVLVTITMSGAMAGLIGIGPLLADQQHYSYSDQFPQTLGFTGLSLALLGRNHPVGIAFAAIFWHAIERGTQPLSGKGFPQEIGQILQGTFLITAVIVFEVMRRKAERDAIAAAADRTAAERQSDHDGEGVPA